MKTEQIKSCFNCTYGKIIDKDKKIILCQNHIDEIYTEPYNDAIYCENYSPIHIPNTEK